jgi:hypothetical protein
VRKVTARFVEVIAITSSNGDCAENSMVNLIGGLAMLKKVILTAALFFALAAGTAGVLQERPAAAREPCAASNCSSTNQIAGSYRQDLPPLW